MEVDVQNSFLVYFFQFKLIINFKLSKFHLRYHMFTFQNFIGSLMFFCFVGVLVSFMFELFMVLLFGVQWFWSPYPVERCSEADLQFNITLKSVKCVICLCWCPCSICRVVKLGKIVNVVWWLSVLFYRLHFSICRLLVPALK